MDKVYVTLESWDWEGSRVVGVYVNLDDAKKSMEKDFDVPSWKTRRKNEWFYHNDPEGKEYAIEEWDVE